MIPQILGIARNPGSPSHLLYLPPLPTDFTSVASTDNFQRSLNSSISRFSTCQMRPTRVSLLRVFFFSSFFSKEQLLFCLSCARCRITQTLGPRAQEILPSLRTLTNQTERTLDLSTRRNRQGTTLVVNVVVVGPFEEEEEGTGVSSDVVKVKGEDDHPRSPTLRNDPGTVTIPQYRFNNKTKSHTHTLWRVGVLRTWTLRLARAVLKVQRLTRKT